MGSVDRDEDRTFAVNFSANGVAKLRTTVMDKLKEFMGDYTDDTLVEYVVVLLKNGRRKEEARNELNVFLGEDSVSFVTWLWDHLQSNIEHYVQPQVSLPVSVAKSEPINVEQGGRNDFRHVHDNDKVVSEKLSRRKHTREWKDPVKKVDESHPLRSSVIERVHEETTQLRDTHAKRSVSPRHVTQKKRNRPDEKIETKRERTVTDAPRRLLQFAVRDAVTTPRSSHPSAEPVLKRLRSVVSASTGDSTHEVSPRKTRVVGAGSNVMAIKAVEEAAKDVIKKRSSGNVFDRLGRSTDIPQQHNQIHDYKKSVVGIEGDSYLMRNRLNGESVENNMLESDTAMAYYESKYYDGYNNVNDAPKTRTYAEKVDSLGVQYSITRNADGILMKPRKVQDQPAPLASALANTSVNLNTWEQTHYAQQSLGLDMDNKKSAPRGDVYVSKSADKLKDNNATLIAAGNGNVKPVAAVTQKVSQKPPTTASPGIYAAGRPTEDADSRTVFVSNVHFAATKDALSRHFNKFGEVLKVIIVTDAATGQPKGSAYVEFMRKESAENALSLDATSFMSRILKIVRKGALGQQEASPPMMSWPGARGGSSSSSAAAFGGSRFLPRGAGAFQRGGSSSYNRSWAPVKAGARSMQWKRDDSTATTTSNDNNTSSVATHIGRSLTYVRNTTDQSKAEGNNHPATTATTTT